MDKIFLSLLSYMESYNETAPSVAQIAWATEGNLPSNLATSTSHQTMLFGNQCRADLARWIPHYKLPRVGLLFVTLDNCLSSAFRSNTLPPHPEPYFLHTCNANGPRTSSAPLETFWWYAVRSTARWYAPFHKGHLLMHGHKHRGKVVVQCPWAGCSDRLRWMNIPRHVRFIRLGVRMACPNCKKSFTRAWGLTKHVTSKKCSLVSGSRISMFQMSIW